MRSIRKWGDNGYYNESLFEDIFGKALSDRKTTTTKKVVESNGWSVGKGPILYRWVDDNTLWIGVPGCGKDNIRATNIGDGKLIITWRSAFSEATIVAPVPDGTQSIEIDVTNGMMVVTFQTKPSDISVIIK